MRRLGNVLIVCAVACLVCMVVVVVTTTLTYNEVLNSLPLSNQIFLEVVVWGFIAAVLGVPGIVLRRVSSRRPSAGQ